jgi:hypothetical protein
MNIFLKIKACFKYSLSFLKSDWDLKDYPIRIKYQKVDESENTCRLIPIPYTAQIINWWAMYGSGNTEEECLNDLQNEFNNFKANNILPGPGTGVPIEFAPTTEIDRLEHIAEIFFKEILDMNYYECFISDQSSLLDFDFSESAGHLFKKVHEIFNVDV